MVVYFNADERNMVLANISRYDQFQGSARQMSRVVAGIFIVFGVISGAWNYQQWQKQKIIIAENQLLKSDLTQLKVNELTKKPNPYEYEAALLKLRVLIQDSLITLRLQHLGRTELDEYFVHLTKQADDVFDKLNTNKNLSAHAHGKKIQALQQEWNQYANDLHALIENYPIYEQVNKKYLEVELAAKQLSTSQEQIIELMQKEKLSSSHLLLIAKLGFIVQRIKKNMLSVKSGFKIDSSVFDELGADNTYAGHILSGMIMGSKIVKITPLKNTKVKKKLLEYANEYKLMNESVSYYLDVAPELDKMKTAETSLMARASALNQNMTQIHKIFADGAEVEK